MPAIDLKDVVDEWTLASNTRGGKNAGVAEVVVSRRRASDSYYEAPTVAPDVARRMEIHSRRSGEDSLLAQSMGDSRLDARRSPCERRVVRNDFRIADAFPQPARNICSTGGPLRHIDDDLWNIVEWQLSVTSKPLNE